MSFDNIIAAIDKLPQDIVSCANRIANREWDRRKKLIITEIQRHLGISDLTERINDIPNKRGRPTHKKIVICKKK